MSGNVTSSYTDSPSRFFLNFLGQLSWCSSHCIQTFPGVIICCPWCLSSQPPHGLLSLTGSILWSSNFKLCYPSPSGQYLPCCPPLLSSLLFSSVFCSSGTCSHIPGCLHLHPIIWQALTTSHRARGTCRQSSKSCAWVVMDYPMTVSSSVKSKQKYWVLHRHGVLRHSTWDNIKHTVNV